MLPAIAFSYEEAEIDIMTRRPRDKEEHLVTSKLMIIAYGQLGVIQTFCGFMAYTVIMFDFGMNVRSMFFVILKDYYPHNITDVYDPNHPTLGNTNIKVENGKLRLLNEEAAGAYVDSQDKAGPRLVDWLFTKHIEQDLRLGYIQYDQASGLVKENVTWSPCRVYQVSPISFRPVCYTTEALKYAQTGFFFGVVIGQWYNSIAMKSRKISIKDQGLKNFFMVFGWATELTLCMLLAYVLPINTVFGTRDLILPHFMLPAIPAAILILTYDEVRKYLIRNWPKDSLKQPNWFERNCCY